MNQNVLKCSWNRLKKSHEHLNLFVHLPDLLFRLNQTFLTSKYPIDVNYKPTSIGQVVKIPIVFNIGFFGPWIFKKMHRNAGRTLDSEDNTKFAAMLLAILHCNTILKITVSEVSQKGTRGDYYLGNPADNNFMEVSGTISPTEFNPRTNKKSSQILSSPVANEGWISVTLFSNQKTESNFYRVK